MPRITHIEVSPYNINLRSSLNWGKNQTLSQLNHVLVCVMLSDGAIGIAEATPRPTIYGETQASIQAIITQYLSPMVIGKSIDKREDIDALDSQLHLIKYNHTAKGALNIAMHSALAQSQNISFKTYLGVKREQVEVSYIVGTGDEASVLNDVDSAYQSGVRVFKMKIGKKLSQELAIIHAVQTTFSDARLYVDANQCLESENVVKSLTTLYEQGILWCEEPLPVQQIRERVSLREQIAMPIIADDSAFTPEALMRELEMNTFDILNIKTARTGYSQSSWMLKKSVLANKQIMIGSQASSLLGCLHAALFAGHFEVGYASECTFFLKTEQDKQDINISDGKISLTDVEFKLRLMKDQLIID